MERQTIIAMLLIGLLCFAAGFVVGVEMSIKKGVYLAQVMMSGGDLNITYNSDIMENLMRKYLNSAQLNAGYRLN